jgi:CheY-like chemotaxis protein/HPt (histidine-containing phosphotransfer) domain-containing protein
MPVKQAVLLDVVLAAVEPAQAPAPVVERSSPSAPAIHPVGGALGRGIQDFEQTILVAEDNPINQKLARLQLQHMGYQVEVVNNGREAVDALAARSYALVLMDCQMPVMDGYEATRAIRRAEQGTQRHVPIVAMTAYAMPGQREDSLAAGMDDHVSKPVRAEQLQAVIERYLNAEPAPRSAGLDNRLDGVPVLDRAVLERWRYLHPAGGSVLVGEIIDVFLTETPAILTAIRSAIMDGDAARLEQSAHRCAGSSANVGARRLFVLCNELEALGRAGITAGTGEHLVRLPVEYERVKEALEQV